MIKMLIKKIRKKWHSDLFQESERLYKQIESLLTVHNFLRGDDVILKPLRGWALSPDALAYVLHELKLRQNPTVIEFGSGQSTIAIASVLKQHGGRLLSIEHDPVYLQSIKLQSEANNLSEVISFVEAPLSKSNTHRHKIIPENTISYSLDCIEDIQIDLALVDGPPYFNGNLTRLVPLCWAIEHLKPEGIIFLDDYKRDSETECVERLLVEFSDIIIKSCVTEKGLVGIIRKEPASGERRS